MAKRTSETERKRREKIKKNHPRYWLGKKRSIEDRKKMSLAKLGKYEGEDNPFFGKTHTNEARKKISDANKGRPSNSPFKKGHVPWNKGLKGFLSKENHYNWQGGKTSENKRLRNSFEMKQWRKRVFKRDNWTCQICKVRGVELQADHIKPFSLYPKLRFKLSNGRTLCIKCHEKTDTFKGRAKTYA